MKNLKKVLALVLSLAMIVSTFTVSFAAEKTDAEIVTALEMLKGEGNGVTDEYLAKASTRFQAALMVLRLQDLEEEAMAFEGTETFADAEDLTWVAGRPVLAYLKANPELGWLGDGESFNPNGPITAQAYYKVMLEAIGYKQGTDFEWADVLEFAAEKGLKKAADVENFTNNEIAVVTVETLKAENSEGVKLVDALVESGAIDEAVAVEVGLVDATPEELAVVSVTALNLKQIEVVFNQEIDGAGDEDNYTLTDDGTATITAASDFELLEDGKTVVITLTTKADQQDVETLEVTGIETEDEVKVEDFEGEVTFLDMTIPTVVNAEVVGNDTIKVIFSEPMNGINKANFKVNDGKLYIKTVALQNNDTEALVTLYSSLKEGEVTIKVLAGTVDYAGFGVIVVTETLAVVEDSDAPVVIGYKDASPTEVTLIWSEDIELTSTTVADDNFYHTNSKNLVDNDLTATEIDGNEMTLKFNDNELPQGTAYVYVLKEAVQDLWNNENAQEMIAVDVELDVTAPEVDGDVSVETETTIRIDFTEDMDSDSVEDIDNYTLLDKDGKEAKLITNVSVVDADTIEITFDEDLSGDYSIVLAALEDLAGNEIADITVPFNVDDLTAPVAADFTATIYNPGLEDQMIRINFADIMSVDGVYSILDTAKYTFNNGTVNMEDLDEDLVEFTVVNDGKSVEIIVPSLVDDPAAGDYSGVNLLASQNIMIGKVADAAGNVTPGVSVTLLAGNITNEGAITNPDAVATAKDTIVMTFDQEVAKLDLDDFVIKTSTGTILQVASVNTDIDSDGNTEVTFELVTDLSAIAESGGFTVGVATIATASENAYGEFINAFTQADVTAADEIAPEVDYVEFINSSLIKVHFDENLNSSYVASAGMNGFTVADADSAKLDAFNNSIINIVSTDGDFTINTNVAYNGTNGIVDASPNLNELASFTENDVMITTPVLTVDYIAETTTEVVATTEEYNTDNDFTTANTDGTGVVLPLTPGTNVYNVYYRTKATTDLPAGPVRTLTVAARPTTAYTVNFVAETTTEVVPATVEYSTDVAFATATDGAGATVAVTPGTNLHFRTKASATNFLGTVQTLVVAARPAAPVHTIAYETELTGEVVPATVEYNTDNVFTTANTDGTGATVAVDPGVDMYFRTKAATGAAFASDIQTLTVIARPALPGVVTVDDDNSATAKVQVDASNALTTDGLEFDLDAAGYADVLDGTEIALDSANKVLFVRVKATPTTFASLPTSDLDN